MYTSSYRYFYVTYLFSFQHGHNAVSLTVAEQYIAAFSNLAKTNNTILLPSNSGDITNMVTQVLHIYKQ